MGLSLYAVCFDSHDPARVAQFWADLLGRDVVEDPWGGYAVSATDRPGFRVRFRASEAPKVQQNWIHFDLTSATPEHMRETIQRARALGGASIDIGQGPDADHEVMADPEGNEFCVTPAGNTFLADTGVIGAINCEGSHAGGLFWREVLDWPLVWDQDEETAVQSREGGSKVTWSGPPLPEKLGRSRVTLELVTTGDAGVDEEVQRLISLGANRTGFPQEGGHGVVLADVDGIEFTVFPSTT